MARANGDEGGRGDLQGEGLDGGGRQRPGAQSRPGAVHGPRHRGGQVGRDVVRHRPEYGTQFRSPTATRMITCPWLTLDACPIFSQPPRRRSSSKTTAWVETLAANGSG